MKCTGLSPSRPGSDFLCSSQHRPHGAHVQAQQVDTGVGVGGQEGGAGGFSPLQVPAGQTQAKTVVLRQQPLAQGQADAAARSKTLISNCNQGF